MFTPAAFLEYAKYCGLATIAIAVLMGVGLFFQWGFRYRLVGVTGFFAVLTVGLFGLSLGFSPRASFPGAVRYSLIYDNGNDQAVVAIAPQKMTREAAEATLHQAANDLYSFGRVGEGDGNLHVRMRSMIHPQPGVTEPLYLGEAIRHPAKGDGKELEIIVDQRNLAKLKG